MINSTNAHIVNISWQSHLVFSARNWWQNQLPNKVQRCKFALVYWGKNFNSKLVSDLVYPLIKHLTVHTFFSPSQHNCCHGNSTTGVILFLLWCTFLVPSFMNTASTLLEIFMNECCTVLEEPPMTSSLSSFAYYKNVNISKKKKDIPKMKTPFFFILKSLSNKQFFFTS